MYYKKTSPLLKSFVTSTKVQTLEYIPYTFALNGHLQALFFMLTEKICQNLRPMPFEREVLALSDGGTIALDWFIDHEGGFPLKSSARPVLCCISGLSGGNDNFYLYSMIKAAT